MISDDMGTGLMTFTMELAGWLAGLGVDISLQQRDTSPSTAQLPVPILSAHTAAVFIHPSEFQTLCPLQWGVMHQCSSKSLTSALPLPSFILRSLNKTGHSQLSHVH